MPVGRRRFIGLGGAGTAAVLLGTGAWGASTTYAAPAGAGNPFTLGVASGDPQYSSVVLWTRLALDPFAVDGLGGMPAKPVRVEYEVARDEHFRHLVRRSSVVATPELGHSVHPEVNGLQPDHEYYYRFRTGGEISTVGRTRTTPHPLSSPREVRFAFASCNAWQDGYFTAYQHMADEDLDLVVHLGDYLYESGVKTNKRGVVTDPRFRRAQAFQAMYENLPLRHEQMPSGPDIRYHRRLPYGRLADFTILDTRQYRSDQPCGDGDSSTCDDRFNPDNTMLGGKQRQWLLDGFRQSRARWQVIGNQTPMGQTDWTPGPETHVWLDPWDGYVAERNKVLAAAQDSGVRNLVVITGDRHQNYALELKRDFADPDSRTVGTEFVGTSITSGGDGADTTTQGEQFLAANPHLKFFNSQRGYVRVTADQHRWRSDFRVLPYVSQPNAPITTRATYVVEDHNPHVDLA